MKKILLTALMVLCFVSAAWPFTAVSDTSLKRSKVTKSPQAVYDTVFQNDIADYDNLKPPSQTGIFVLRQQRETFSEKPQLSWFPYSQSSPFLLTDDAIAMREIIKLPSEGKLIFSRKLEVSDGVYSVIEWQYKVFADDYARITRRINFGAGINVYDGPPLKEADFTSIFFLKPVVAHLSPGSSLTLDSAVSDSPYASEKLIFEQPSLLKDAYLTSAVTPGESAAILDVSKNTLSQPVSSLRWRMTVLSANTNSIHDVVLGTSKNDTKIHWNGMIYKGKVPCADGEYRLRFDIWANVVAGQIKFATCEQKVSVAKIGRLTVANGSGEIISDSRFNGVVLAKESERMHICKPYQYVPYPKAYYYGINRIYMKKNSSDDTFKIKFVTPSKEKMIQAYVSSSLRNPLMIPLRSSSDGEYTGSLLVTSKTKSPVGALVTGNAVQKSFAFLDTTYPEDSQALSSALRARGWVSRGSIDAEELTMPEKGAFLADFIRSGGYETFVFSFDDGNEKISSKLMMKNQADIFYYSGHGWADGSIHNGVEHFHPETKMEIGDWNDGMSLAIFSSCSVLDIMNVKNRKFTAIGNFNLSPGEYWAKAAGSEVTLLGYNWSTFEGKPPNAFDTRVIRSFIARMGSEPNISAWMSANISNNDASAPCAIFNGTYYYLDGAGRVIALPQSKWSNH